MDRKSVHFLESVSSSYLQAHLLAVIILFYWNMSDIIIREKSIGSLPF